jgi:hypothetical protein
VLRAGSSKHTTSAAATSDKLFLSYGALHARPTMMASAATHSRNTPCLDIAPQIGMQPATWFPPPVSSSRSCRQANGTLAAASPQHNPARDGSMHSGQCCQPKQWVWLQMNPQVMTGHSCCVCVYCLPALHQPHARLQCSPASALACCPVQLQLPWPAFAQPMASAAMLQCCPLQPLGDQHPPQRDLAQPPAVRCAPGRRNKACTVSTYVPRTVPHSSCDTCVCVALL